MYPWIQINSPKVVKDIISLEKVLNNLSEDGAKEIDDDFVFLTSVRRTRRGKKIEI